MIPIRGYASFHSLRHCIVGKAHADQSTDGRIKQIVEETNQDLDKLVDVLHKFDVVCHRPMVGQSKARPPISPRDYFAAVGEHLLVGKVIQGYKQILRDVDRRQIKWYLGNDVSTGNMMRCGKHIHWDVSKDVTPEVEREICSWLEGNGHTVTITRYGWHMDGVYSIIKPGVIIATRDLPELERMYPRWQIHYANSTQNKKPIDHSWGGDYMESNYDVNILSIDEENCVSTSTDKHMLNFLDKQKVNHITVDLRHKEFWDNGLHCMTQDLYREGDLEDYR